MFPPFPTERAEQECIQLINELRTHGRLDIDVDAPDSDPAYALDVIRKDSPGFMIGVCICRDRQGREHLLKAFSGQYNGRWICPGWCPPLLDSADYDRCIAESDVRIHMMSDTIAELQSCCPAPGSENAVRLSRLKVERAALSRQSMRDIFDLYRVHCLDGSVLSFRDMFPDAMVPTGTGDCCAPKLINAAAVNGWRPISLAECFYSYDSRCGTFHTPCDGKCSRILPTQLGLSIVYRDDHIIVIDKQSGLLSVPGRGEDKQDCAVTRVQRLFPDCMQQPSVHRLDMDTSGLLVLAFDAASHRDLSLQFMNGTVRKEYEAMLDGIPAVVRGGIQSGTIVSHFRLDPDNRPHQVYDPVYGKEGRTDWQVLSIEQGKARMLFIPHTGRTHQLRLHSAHSTGLGVPICGDNLYGVQHPGERLKLHCRYLAFVHPFTNAELSFRAPVPF